MNDSERVGVGQSDTALKDEFHGPTDGERAALFDPRAEIFTLEVLHNDVGHPVWECVYVDDASDVFTFDFRGRAGAGETRLGLGVSQRFGQKKLDSDFLVERDVVCGEDNAHAARPETGPEPVLAGEQPALKDARTAR